jgi:small ligand-binding sensory domain FIST
VSWNSSTKARPGPRPELSRGAEARGLASGGRRPGENALFLGGRLHRSGVVGVALSGDVRVDTIVAQGCRPIGAPMFVTRCREHILQELDGRPATHVLQELYHQLPPDDQQLLRTSLFLGIEMKEAQGEYRQGDFLIRNLIGLDPESGALAVAATLRTTEVVQFHLRDARTWHDDLARRLTRFREEAAGTSPQGRCSSRAWGEGCTSTVKPTTRRGRSVASWATSRSAGSSATARSAPCRGRPSSTGTPARSGSFAPPE